MKVSWTRIAVRLQGDLAVDRVVLSASPSLDSVVSSTLRAIDFPVRLSVAVAPGPRGQAVVPAVGKRVARLDRVVDASQSRPRTRLLAPARIRTRRADSAAAKRPRPSLPGWEAPVPAAGAPTPYALLSDFAQPAIHHRTNLVLARAVDHRARKRPRRSGGRDRCRSPAWRSAHRRRPDQLDSKSRSFRNRAAGRGNRL